MALPTRVYLTGFMGSGKSTVGPLLAARLGYGFLDLDEHVAARAGKPIPRLFAEDGEQAFRALEAALLRETAREERRVVALGGGAFVADANARWTRRHGTVVYLRVPVDELARRLRKGQHGRPLLRDETGRPLTLEALTRRIESLVTEREPFYRRAHLVVEAGRRDPEATAQAVMKALRAEAGFL